MTPRTRDVRPEPPAVDRWPAVRSAFSDLLAECEDIGGRGRAAFDAPRSLTYRAAEAVVIHFADLVEHRLPKARPALVPTELPLQAMRTTRTSCGTSCRPRSLGSSGRCCRQPTRASTPSLEYWAPLPGRRLA